MATTTVLFDILARDRASSTIDKVGRSASTTTTKMERFHKVGAAAGVALAAGLVLVGKAAVDMTKKAAEDEASASKLAQTLHVAAHATDAQVAATESWISAQEKALGVSDEDLRPALSKLAVATGSVTKAQKLASLAMDVSAGTGKSLESVSMALAKAQNGNISGLGRLGIATKDAAGNTLTLTQVQKQLSDHFSGAAAKAAGTAAGKQKILTVQMQELQEQIGYKLLPVMLKLVDVGLKVVDWVSRNTTTVGVFIGTLGTLLAVTWTASVAIKAVALAETLLGVTTAETTGLTIAQRVALVASAAAAKAAAAAQWLLNVAMEANPIGLVVIAVAALAAGLIYAYKHSETFRRIVDGAFHAVAAAAKAAFGWIKGAATATFNWIKGHWKLLAAILGGPIVAATIVIINNWGKIKAGANNLWSAIKVGASKVKAFILLPFQLAKAAVSAVWQNMKQDASNFVGYIAAIPGRLRDLVGRFKDAGLALIHAFWDGVLAAARSAGGFIGSLVADIKAAINSALSLPLTVDFDKGPLHIHATLIPALAAGGIVNRPTLAMIGEAGPEAVVPLSGPNARRLGGGGDIHITVNASGLVDAPSMAKQIEKELTKLKNTRGGQQLGFV